MPLLTSRLARLTYTPGQSSGVPRGGAGGGGYGPRAQALEGAPAQLVGANFKKKIMPRQIRKVASLQCRIRGSFFSF